MEDSNLIEDAHIEYSQEFVEQVNEFTNDLAQIMRKHNISFMNRDALDESGNYMFTQIFLQLNGEIWYADDFISILEEALIRSHEQESND